MAILPISSFPLRASDQADVMRIFLDLMCESDREKRAAEGMPHMPLGVDPEHSAYWGGLRDLD